MAKLFPKLQKEYKNAIEISAELTGREEFCVISTLRIGDLRQEVRVRVWTRSFDRLERKLAEEKRSSMRCAEVMGRGDGGRIRGEGQDQGWRMRGRCRNIASYRSSELGR